MNIFPGENFEIEVAAVGQRLGVVPSIVSVTESPSKDSLSTSQDVQSVGRQCTTLHFTVSTQRSLYTLKLRVQDAGTPRDRLLKGCSHQDFTSCFNNSTLS